MTDKVVVLVTCGSAEEASRMARVLVEERVAACVNISGPIRSVYRWKRKLCDDAEVLLVIKTSRALFDRVRRTVERLHSYQVPEVLCLPVIDGAPNYLNWLSASLGGELGPRPPLRPAKPKAAKRRNSRRG